MKRFTNFLVLVMILFISTINRALGQITGPAPLVEFQSNEEFETGGMKIIYKNHAAQVFINGREFKADMVYSRFDKISNRNGDPEPDASGGRLCKVELADRIHYFFENNSRTSPSAGLAGIGGGITRKFRYTYFNKYPTTNEQEQKVKNLGFDNGLLPRQ